MTNYRVNLAFSEASFEMIIVITPEKEADPYNGQFSFDHTIATEKKNGPRGPVSHNETICFGIFFNATNTAIYGERFPVSTISRKSSCLSSALDRCRSCHCDQSTRWMSVVSIWSQRSMDIFFQRVATIYWATSPLGAVFWRFFGSIFLFP